SAVHEPLYRLATFSATSVTDFYTLSLHDALPIFYELKFLPLLLKGVAAKLHYPRYKISHLPSLYVASSTALTSNKINKILIFSRSEEHTSELQSRENLVCRLLLEKKN